MGATIEKRIYVTPSPDSGPLLVELARLTGKSPARVIRELLDEAMPGMVPLIEALKVVNSRPDLARQAMLQAVEKASDRLIEIQLDLKLPREKPGRKARAR